MMSERWAGFTDEDIEKIKSNPSVTKSCSDTICELDGYTSQNRGPMKIKKIPLKPHSYDMYEVNAAIYNGNKDFPPDCKELSSLKDSDAEFISSENEENCTCSSYGYEDGHRDPVMVNVRNICDETDDQKCEELDQSSTNLLPLEVFEMRQKRIEAENARRRSLISKAINDKKKHTQAEAIKLAQITQELNRIDSSLSADVSILRDYIEKASLEFSEAEKRYLKAEKEFVEAKLALFEKMQRKEMLTEHLCAIIEQNENRKADKLVELMKQLEMEVILDDCETNGIQPILPNLCALNDESYHNCQTIKPSLSRGSSQNTVDENVVSEATQTLEKREDTEASNEIEESIPNSLNIKRNPTIEGDEQA